jgi:hypothetical protein
MKRTNVYLILSFVLLLCSYLIVQAIKSRMQHQQFLEKFENFAIEENSQVVDAWVGVDDDVLFILKPYYENSKQNTFNDDILNKNLQTNFTFFLGFVFNYRECSRIYSGGFRREFLYQLRLNNKNFGRSFIFARILAKAVDCSQQTSNSVHRRFSQSFYTKSKKCYAFFRNTKNQTIFYSMPKKRFL